MMASKAIKSLIIAVIITAVITFVISFLIFKYLPDSSQNLKINEYKKALYVSTLCQYSCPLTLQEVQNKSEYLPEQSCITNCTDNFKESQTLGDDISNNQIKNDGLLSDMSDGITACKNSAVDAKLMTTNATLFFSCSIKKLAALKNKYSYLN